VQDGEPKARPCAAGILARCREGKTLALTRRVAPARPPPHAAQTSILVRNLPRDVRQDELRDLFSKFGAQRARHSAHWTCAFPPKKRGSRICAPPPCGSSSPDLARARPRPLFATSSQAA
jgi:hypothetical protein